MATTIAELNIKLDADTGKAKSNLKDVDKGLKDVGASATSATGSTGGFLGALKGGAGGLMTFVNPLGLATAGIGLLATGMMKAVDAAKEEQIGIDRLNQTLKNNIPNWNGNTEAVENYIAGQEKLSFADDQLRDSLGLLVSQTGDLAEAQGLQATAMDLARAKGISLEQATRLILKADDESFAALGKLGIQIDKNATKEQALDEIRRQTAGQAEKYANSAAGAQERLGNMMGNVMEDIGGVLLPLFTNALQGAITTIEFLATTAGDVMRVMQAWGENIMTFLKPGIDAITGAWQGFMEILQPGIDAVNGLIGGIQEAFGGFFGTMEDGGDIFAAFGQLFEDLGGTIEDFVGNVLEWLGDAIPKIGSELEKWAKAFWEWIQKDAIPGLMTALGKLGEAIWGWITGGGLQGLVSNLVQWGGAILGFIAKDVLPFLGQKLLDLGKFIWDWITGGGLTSLISNLIQWGGAFLGFIAKDVLPFIGQKLGELGKAIWDWISQTATDLVKELAKFAVSFWTWITGENGVVAGIPGKLAEIWTGITKWIGETVTNIVTEGAKLVTAFWDWITGPTGIVANIGTKLGEVWTAITTWVTDTVKNIPAEAGKIGGAMLDGIMSGIGNLGKQLWDFISKIANDIWQGLVSFFTGQPAPTPTTPTAPNPDPPTPPVKGPPPGYGRKAEGGPVWAGGTYLVGERGPEMFVPKMSGSIIPNHALGGDTFQVTIHAGIGSDPHVIGQVVTQAISRSLSLRQRSKGFR